MSSKLLTRPTPALLRVVLIATIWFSNLAESSEGYYDQLVKTVEGYYVFADNGYDWPYSLSCSATKVSSSSFNQAPGASDPGVQTSSPVVSLSGCPIWDSDGDGQPEHHFNVSFNSLHDLGDWRITCTGYSVDPAACISASYPPCNIVCDTAYVTPYTEDAIFNIDVYNDRPTANPTHSPTPAWNTTVTLDANANDPDGGSGSLDYSWSITEKPVSSTKSLSSSSVEKPTISFNSDDDIGDWEFRVHVDDNEGERRTFTHDFEVPNVPPNIHIDGPDEIDVLSDISLSISSTNDVDGGTFDITWDILSVPPSASEAPQSNYSTNPSITIPTTQLDIGFWEFKVTATDNENAEDSDTHVIEVKNLPPEIDLTGIQEIDAGDTIQIETNIHDDIDGGVLTFRWDILQAPQSSSIFVQEGYMGGSGAAGAVLTIPTGPDDAGTWIFRLVATDDDGQDNSEVTESIEVLVDGPVQAVITGPDVIGSLSFPLTLDGSDSVDSDTPCPDIADQCHDTLDGDPVVISPGIINRIWRLVDVPFEFWDEYPLGRVDEVFGVTATAPTLTLEFGDLKPGEWVFELQVTDGEGNTEAASHTITVIDEGGAPFAIVDATQRYNVDLANMAVSDIVVNGSNSFDLDNLISPGEPIGPGVGISNYAWSLDLVPAGCPTPPAAPSGAAASTFTLFTAGNAVHPLCQGFWTIGLTVTDDDGIPKTADAETGVIIGGCPAGLCIDYPTTLIPESVEFTDATDILIFYRLDAVVYDDPFFFAGLVAHLEIYHESNLISSPPVYTDDDPNILPTSKGGMLVFHWDGYTDSRDRPEPGQYTIKIGLMNALSGFSSLFEVEEPNSIWIAVAEPKILDTSDEFINFDKLDSGTDTVDINYGITGTAIPDSVRWRVRDASSLVIFEETVPYAPGGSISWNGQDGGGTASPGYYESRLEFLRGADVMGESASWPFVIYDLAVTPVTGVASDVHPGLLVYVNNDDDNLNAVSDLTESAVGENDLIRVDIAIDPPMVGALGSFDTSSPAPVPLRLWDTAAKASENILASVNPLPAEIFIEGIIASESDLTLTVQTSGGTTLDPETIALTVIDVKLMEDTNNDHVLGIGDSQIYNTNIARWDNGYNAAFAVENAADPANFIEQDPRRFYVQVEDASANTDSTTVQQISVQLGTADTPLAAAAMDDDLSEVRLTETGVDTGIFISPSQLLVSHDIQVLDDAAADDEFNADNGSGAAVADDALGDRTHQTDMDGGVRLQYQPASAAAAQQWSIPVCQRVPDLRRRVELRTRIFNEPYQDLGYDHDGIAATPAIGAGNGTFDFDDANVNGSHDAGERSERFIDLSGGAAVFANVGSRGGVVSLAQANAQIERANIAWAQACIRVESLGLTFVDAPTDALGNDILADAIFSAADASILISTFAPAATFDVAEVFYVAPIAGANAFAQTPSDMIAALGEKTFIYIRPGLAINFRTLAHELGHAMDNQWDAPNTQLIFYPANSTFTDDAINQYRRITDVTESNVRTVRPAGVLGAIGSRLTKP